MGWVNTRALVCKNPWGMASGGQARRSIFPDWPWLCDESSPHLRALHIPAQILAGKFKMELLPTISLTKEFPVAQIRLNLQKSFPAESLTNNWMGTKSWGLGASGVRSKVWVLTIRVLEVNPHWDSAWDGLWRPGGAFFQIGLGCVMSHHHIEGLCTFLFKF